MRCKDLNLHNAYRVSSLSLARSRRQKASSVTSNGAAGLFNKIWLRGLIGRVKKGSARLNGDNYPSCARGRPKSAKWRTAKKYYLYAHVAQMKFHANLRLQTPGQIEFHLP